MKKHISGCVLAIVLMLTPQVSKADLFGGDVVVLTQILANSLEQLIQLRQILSSGEDNLALLRDVNSGINTVLGLANTISQTQDPGLYKNLASSQDALRYLNGIYGDSIDSGETEIQQHADQSVAEAISLNNSIYDYAKDIDRVGQNIERHSELVSPKGAQKLTAQSLGVILHVMNQSLRTQATGLKLQAQAMAIQNHKDKQYAGQVRGISAKLHAAMSATKPEFKFPRL